MTENEERITIGQLEELVNEQPLTSNSRVSLDDESIKIDRPVLDTLGSMSGTVNGNNDQITNASASGHDLNHDLGLNSIKLTLDNDKQKNKLIEIIETFEVTNPKEAKTIKYPESCGFYKFGDSLRNLEVEQLQKIIKIQNSLNQFSQFARIGAIMTIQGCKMLEEYVDDLNGFGANTANSLNEIEQCMKEILLNHSDDIEDVMTPEVRLLLILASSAGIVYSVNKAKKKNNNNITTTNASAISVNHSNAKDTLNLNHEHNGQQLPVKRGRGRPRKLA